MQGKRVAVSGSGNVAIYTVEKLLELGAVPVTMSDSTGYIYEEKGFTNELLMQVNEIKVVNKGTLKDYKSSTGEALTDRCMLLLITLKVALRIMCTAA